MTERNHAPGRARLRLLAALLAFGAGAGAVGVAVLFVHTVLG